MIRKFLKHGTIWTACLGVMAPTALRAASPYAPPQVGSQPAAAAATTPAVSPVVDVVLSPEGRLVGRVVDSSGKAAAQVPVSIRQQGVQVAQYVTDENGVFVGENHQGGVHEVVTPETSQTYRLWTPNAAPPVATGQMEVIHPPVHRGQHMPPRRFPLLTNPWVIGMGIAAAIAIPLALDDDDDNAS